MHMRQEPSSIYHKIEHHAVIIAATIVLVAFLAASVIHALNPLFPGLLPFH
jgi:hypothetical protein